MAGFDDANETPNRAINNCSNLPPVGSGEWQARVDAEIAARNVAGSGNQPHTSGSACGG